MAKKQFIKGMDVSTLYEERKMGAKYYDEVTNGLLWPYGAEGNYDNIARFLNAGIRGVREEVPDAEIMLHLDCGGNNEKCRQWFDACGERGEDFDVIGLSYYPFWHGTIDDLTDNMNDLAVHYGKEMIVAEVSMGYTIEDYADREKLAPGERKGMAANPRLAEAVEFPMTRKGQSERGGGLLLGACMDPDPRMRLGKRDFPCLYE